MIWLKKIYTLLLLLRYRDAWSMPPSILKSCFKMKRFFRPVITSKGISIDPTIPMIGRKSFGSFLKGIKRLMNGVHTPIVVHIAITDDCNYHCQRCSNFPSKDNYPSLTSLKKIIGELKQHNTALINFTGGEPTLRRDLPELISSCGAEIAVSMFTSGQGMDNSFAKNLSLSGLEKAYISLDHYRKSVHNKTRGCNTAYDQALKTIKLCLKNNIYTIAQAVIDENLNADNDIIKYINFVKELGVHEIMFLEVMPIKFNDKNLPLTKQIHQKLKELQLTSNKNYKLPKISTMSLSESPECVGCQAGISFIYINTEGEVFPCDFLPFSFGNIYQDGLDTILRRLSNFIPSPSGNCIVKQYSNHIRSIDFKPIPWHETKVLLKDYNPGPPPALMTWFHN